MIKGPDRETHQRIPVPPSRFFFGPLILNTQGKSSKFLEFRIRLQIIQKHQKFSKSNNYSLSRSVMKTLFEPWSSLLLATSPHSYDTVFHHLFVFHAFDDTIPPPLRLVRSSRSHVVASSTFPLWCALRVFRSVSASYVSLPSRLHLLS